MKITHALVMTTAIALATAPAFAANMGGKGTVEAAKNGALCKWFTIGENKFFAVSTLEDWTAINDAGLSGAQIEFKFDPTVTLSCGTGHGDVSGPTIDMPVITGLYVRYVL